MAAVAVVGRPLIVLSPKAAKTVTKYHQGKVFARAKDRGRFHDMGGKKGQGQGCQQARDETP